jgi:hypothetical protein
MHRNMLIVTINHDLGKKLGQLLRSPQTVSRSRAASESYVKSRVEFNGVQVNE